MVKKQVAPAHDLFKALRDRFLVVLHAVTGSQRFFAQWMAAWSGLSPRQRRVEYCPVKYFNQLQIYFGNIYPNIVYS